MQTYSSLPEAIQEAVCFKYYFRIRICTCRAWHSDDRI